MIVPPQDIDISPTRSRSRSAARGRDAARTSSRSGRSTSRARIRRASTSITRSDVRLAPVPDTVTPPDMSAPVLPASGEIEMGSPTRRKQVMVVGLGMVGIAFIEKMLALDTAGEYFIRTCGEEPTVAYNRVGLTEYFQHRNIEDLYLNPVSWYAEQSPEHFAFHIGEQVVDIDTKQKVVHTNKGNTYRWDILVLATGSVGDVPAFVQPDQLHNMKGIFTYRNLSDLDSIINYAARPFTRSCTVVGGGLLGLEAAKAVYDLPTVDDVSIVIRSGYPLNRQLDEAAGELVLAKIEGMGVKVHTHCSPQSICTEKYEDGERFSGFQAANKEVGADMMVLAVGIKPRDDLARCGIKIAPRGGFEVGDDLSTSVEGVYAIGECASWRGNYYGLIAPGIEMADILSFNLTQTKGTGAHAPRKMNAPDLSTRLKLMGVDVASFGDYFADERSTSSAVSAKPEPNGTVAIHKPSRRLRADGAVRCLTYHDPFSATYKKYIFTEDGQHLLGGMMIGDVGDFTKLVAITKKKKKLDVPPSQFILGSKSNGEDDGAELDDDAVVCSCHNVTKGAIARCVKDGVSDVAGVKAKTKAGAGCGGCVPLVTNIFKAEMKKAGFKLNNSLCIHFSMPRKDLFQITKIKRLRTFRDVMDTAGVPGSIGCEICKPAVASILAGLYNDHVMKPELHGLQDTNDRYLANIQRNGTFSVVPRLPGGEVKPAQLLAIGAVAEEFGLYTKITGAQRIDLFGAPKDQLPLIWEKLHAAGLESGQAYAKSLRAVKSCVGSSWCRFGVGDSVGLAIALEERYRGIRAPHKFKGGVSGCVRECAEAQGKDFGLIATDKGWNIFVGGNGGMTPRHAQLLAQDVPPSKVTRILDRYIMFYVRTADRLMRTAPWVESFEGGIEKLRKILLEDELGICTDLEAEMQTLVDSYEDEWKRAVEDPATRAKFKQFANTTETQSTVEVVQERGQPRPADWPKDFPPVKFVSSDLPTPREQWDWVTLAHVDDLRPTDAGTTSTAVKYGGSSLAIFHVPTRGYYATQQMCPHKRAFVLESGLVGDDAQGRPYVSCPLHKRNFRLDDGECTNDAELGVLTFDVREVEGKVQVKLPPKDELAAVLGTEKWKVRDGDAKTYGAPQADANIGCASGCGDSKLEW